MSEKLLRIRLTQDLPVDPALGMTAGKEIDVRPNTEDGRVAVYFWYDHPDGPRVGIFGHEAEILETDDAN